MTGSASAASTCGGTGVGPGVNRYRFCAIDRRLAGAAPPPPSLVFLKHKLTLDRTVPRAKGACVSETQSPRPTTLLLDGSSPRVRRGSDRPAARRTARRALAAAAPAAARALERGPGRLRARGGRDRLGRRGRLERGRLPRLLPLRRPADGGAARRRLAARAPASGRRSRSRSSTWGSRREWRSPFRWRRRSAARRSPKRRSTSRSSRLGSWRSSATSPGRWRSSASPWRGSAGDRSGNALLLAGFALAAAGSAVAGLGAAQTAAFVAIAACLLYAGSVARP